VTAQYSALKLGYRLRKTTVDCSKEKRLLALEYAGVSLDSEAANRNLHKRHVVAES
jgi:hypothetical protein